MTQITAERPPAPALGFDIRPEQPGDAPAIQALNDRAFGPGRFAKVSYAIREEARSRPDLSFCAFEGGELVGSVHQSEISLGDRNVIFLGPLSVDVVCRHRGLGGMLIERAVEAAAAQGAPGVLLVGDLGLFGPHGFVRAPRGQVELPRPVDAQRILWRTIDGGGLDAVAGRVGAPKTP